MDIYSLPAISALSDFVTICQLDGIKLVRIQHPKAKAAISLFGGHLISYQPTGEKELIWLSDNADLSGKKPIRGGIPVCWPWFGKAAEPSHGFVRNQQWVLNQHRENDTGVIVSLKLEDNDETRAIWSHPFHLELLVEVTENLKVSLISTNPSNEKFTMGGALHSYFNIADITDTLVTNLGQHYLEAGKENSSDGTAVFTCEVDRIYTAASTSNEIKDNANQRTIHVKHLGNNAVVVWNPWQEVATSMADMQDDGYKTMVCVETALYDNKLTLEADRSHILAVEISLSN